MEKFKFSDNTFSIDVAGVLLKADAAEAELVISKCHKDIVAFCEKMISGGAEQTEIKDNIIRTMDTLDSAFGNGVSKAIFKDRAVSLHDCVDVLMYIIAGLNEFENDKKELYRSYRRPNREQRRNR